MRKLIVVCVVLISSCIAKFAGDFDYLGIMHPGPDMAGGALVFGQAEIYFDNWRDPKSMRSVTGVVRKGLRLTIVAGDEKGNPKRTYDIKADNTGYFQLVNVDPECVYRAIALRFPAAGYEEELDKPLNVKPAGRILNLGHHLLKVDTGGAVTVTIHKALVSTDETVKLALQKHAGDRWEKLILEALTDLEPNDVGGALLFGLAEMEIVDSKGHVRRRTDGLRVVIAQYAKHFLYGHVTLLADKNGYFQLANAPGGHYYAVESVSADDIKLQGRFPPVTKLAPGGRVLNMGTVVVRARIGKGVFCAVRDPNRYDTSEPPVVAALARHKEGAWRALILGRAGASTPDGKAPHSLKAEDD